MRASSLLSLVVEAGLGWPLLPSSPRPAAVEASSAAAFQGELLGHIWADGLLLRRGPGLRLLGRWARRSSHGERGRPNQSQRVQAEEATTAVPARAPSSSSATTAALPPPPLPCLSERECEVVGGEHGPHATSRRRRNDVHSTSAPPQLVPPPASPASFVRARRSSSSAGIGIRRSSSSAGIWRRRLNPARLVRAAGGAE
ncbi:unnamed protein product [Urochloa humidicola]